MLLADGQSVVWASRLLGRPLPERVAGIDLFEALLGLADREAPLDLPARRTARGARQRSSRSSAPGGPGPSSLAPRRLLHRRRGGRGRRGDPRAPAPDMLFLGMTSPKKEIFLGRYGDELGVPVLHGVGGSFDVLAGVTKRAPVAWQRAGMEWAYRLMQEPGRLWRRYLTHQHARSSALVAARAWFAPDACRTPTSGSPAHGVHVNDVFTGRVAVDRPGLHRPPDRSGPGDPRRRRRRRRRQPDTRRRPSRAARSRSSSPTSRWPSAARSAWAG